MKEKKINLKVANFITIAVLLLVFGILFFMYYMDNKPERSITSVEGLTSTTTTYRNTNKKVPMESNVEYKLIEDSILLEYYGGLDSKYIVNINDNNLFVTSKDELLDYLSKSLWIYSESGELDYLTSDLYLKHKEVLSQFDDEFFEKNNLIVMLGYSQTGITKNLSSIIVEDRKATVNSLQRYSSADAIIAILPMARIEFISIDKSIDEVEFNMYYEEVGDNYGLNAMIISSGVISVAVIILVNLIISKYNKRKENKSRTRRILENMNFIIFTLVFIGIIIFSAIVFAEAMLWKGVNDNVDKKPIIYLYPTEEINVNVKL